MQKNAVSEGSKDSRAKVPLRQRYLLEKERIRQEHGDLEQIRLTLGLSQRKVCQLLLVDPSAWTRWNKTGAPPHIYQALRWLIELRKTNPDATPLPDQLDRRVDALQSVTNSKLKELESNLASLERTLTFASTLAPQSAIASTDVTLELERALRTQEMKFQLEIANLKARLDELQSQKRRAPKPKRKTGQKPQTSNPKRRPTRQAAQKLKPAKAKAKPAKKIPRRKRPKKKAPSAHRKLRRTARRSR